MRCQYIEKYYSEKTYMTTVREGDCSMLATNHGTAKHGIALVDVLRSR